MYDKDPIEAEKYFIIAMSSFLEKINDTEELYFGESDFEFMLNDFRSGTLKYHIFYEIGMHHENNLFFSPAGHPFIRKLPLFFILLMISSEPTRKRKPTFGQDSEICSS